MGHTVLIVDDETPFLQIMNLVLARFGYTLLLAENGEEGLNLIYEKQPDLIVLDDMLPGISGSEICALIKQDERVKHIPVILYSAGDRVRNEAFVQKIGADQVIYKPIKPPQMAKVVQEMLAKVPPPSTKPPLAALIQARETLPKPPETAEVPPQAEAASPVQCDAPHPADSAPTAADADAPSQK